MPHSPYQVVKVRHGEDTVRHALPRCEDVKDVFSISVTRLSQQNLTHLRAESTVQVRGHAAQA